MTAGKIVLLMFGGLFAFMGVWAGLLLWIGRDFDSHAEAFRKTYREGKTRRDSQGVRSVMDDLQTIAIAAFAIALMFVVWLFVSPFQSKEPRSPEDEADDQTFTM